MVLDTLALTIGKQVVAHATRAWLGHRKGKTERDSQLTDLLATGVTDQFAGRKLARQLDDIGDQVARRLTPLVESEFRDLPTNERKAALDAVVDSLTAADLTDDLLLGSDVDATKLARTVRRRVAGARPQAGLNEAARKLYDLVLDESCVCLVNVVTHLPAFQPRAAVEMLGRLSAIEEILERLPRTTLEAPRGTEHDPDFTTHYLGFISKTLDELELFGGHTPVQTTYLRHGGVSQSVRLDDNTTPAVLRSGRALVR